MTWIWFPAPSVCLIIIWSAFPGRLDLLFWCPRAPKESMKTMCRHTGRQKLIAIKYTWKNSPEADCGSPVKADNRPLMEGLTYSRDWMGKPHRSCQLELLTELSPHAEPVLAELPALLSHRGHGLPSRCYQSWYALLFSFFTVVDLGGIPTPRQELLGVLRCWREWGPLFRPSWLA